VELFLARRNGKVVGRIAAIDDALWNQFHNTETGFFGMFDAPNDPEVPERCSTPRQGSLARGA
jgi:hypothetical protein